MSDELEADQFAGVDLMPDRQRVSNPWLQILRDLTAPAPVSNWAAEVTRTRIREYDRIRTFVTRGVLLVATVVLLVIAPGTWWLTWALLIPAAVQVVLEIYVDFQLYATEQTRIRSLKTVVDITESAHSETLVNFTGIVGAVAVPCNIVAVSYFSGPGEPSWAKVAALAAVAAYGVSAILNFLTDTTHYSANQPVTKPYRAFRALRPYIWLIAAVFTAAMLGVSIALHRWAPVMVPFAWAVCLVPVVTGMKQRDYERFLRASSELLPDVQRSAKEVLVRDYHNTFTDIRVFNRDLARDESVPPAIRVKAAALAPMISLMAEAIDHDQWVKQQQRPSLEGIATKTGSDSSLNLSVDIRLDDLRPENYEVARALIAGLLANVGQAIVKVNGDMAERGEGPADARVKVTGELRDGQVHIAVLDRLPMLADWPREGSTTLWLHKDLVARGGRGLSQQPIDPENPNAGKEIRACWPIKRPPLKLREARR